MIKGKKDGTGISFEFVILGEDVNSEGGLGVKPDGKGLFQLNQMMLSAANSGTPTVSLASNVLDPYRSCVAEFFLFFIIVFNWYFIRIKTGS